MKIASFIIAGVCAVALGWYFLNNSSNSTTAQKAQDTIIVGTNAEFAPFTFYKDGAITGFDIEVIKAIARKLNKTVIIKDFPFEALIPEIQTGHIQVIVAGMNPTPERAKQVHFTQPIFEGDPLVIISPKDAPIQTIKELEGKTVLVNEGYFADMYISKEVPGATIVRLGGNSVAEGLLALNARRGNVFIATESTIVPNLTAEQKKLLHIVPLPEAKENDAIAVSHKYPELFAQIEEKLAELKAEGFIDQLVIKWFKQ